MDEKEIVGILDGMEKEVEKIQELEKKESVKWTWKINKQRLIFKVVLVLLVLSLMFNVLQFVVTNALSNANASIAKYVTDLNCGIFGRTATQALQDSNFGSQDLNLGKLGIIK